ncbi:translation elongation factor Ts [Leptothermofonsia sichuanensis E412]|nr:translation elongation factor Ts [Leptothermofonsia sichuanensis]QZZ21380.1 translation elongation factor Ts [Leptothermofonsia sichuanensis E412]
MAEITAKLVSELRQKTGAGMMDCKKALTENGGDLEKATEWLRKKGIASAEKKAGKTAAEGLVGSYIHTGGRLGVLVEVNCQTDFVARNEAFKKLVQDVAMQVAANTQVEYVRVSDIPAAIVEKEKAIEMGKDDLAGKPDNIKEKIVQGRIEKRLHELCLLSQPYIRDQNITVEELVKQHIAQLGENIQVRRFVRFVLGEGIEREETDFAAEVAAQMGTQTPEKTAEAPVAETLVAEEASVAEAPVAEEASVAKEPAKKETKKEGKKKKK